jgi:hypothetical protein
MALAKILADEVLPVPLGPINKNASGILPDFTIFSRVALTSGKSRSEIA